MDVVSFKVQAEGTVDDYAEGSTARADLEASLADSTGCFFPCIIQLTITAGEDAGTSRRLEAVDNQVVIETELSIPSGGDSPSSVNASSVLAATEELMSGGVDAISEALNVPVTSITEAPAVAEGVTVLVRSDSEMAQAAAATGAPVPEAEDEATKSKQSMEMGVVIGSVFGSVAMVCVLLGLACLWRKMHSPAKVRPATQAGN